MIQAAFGPSGVHDAETLNAARDQRIDHLSGFLDGGERLDDVSTDTQNRTPHVDRAQDLEEERQVRIGELRESVLSLEVTLIIPCHPCVGGIVSAQKDIANSHIRTGWPHLVDIDPGLGARCDLVLHDLPQRHCKRYDHELSPDAIVHARPAGYVRPNGRDRVALLDYGEEGGIVLFHPEHRKMNLPRQRVARGSGAVDAIDRTRIGRSVCLSVVEIYECSGTVGNQHVTTLLLVGCTEVAEESHRMKRHSCSWAALVEHRPAFFIDGNPPA